MIVEVLKASENLSIIYGEYLRFNGKLNTFSEISSLTSKQLDLGNFHMQFEDEVVFHNISL